MTSGSTQNWSFYKIDTHADPESVAIESEKGNLIIAIRRMNMLDKTVTGSFRIREKAFLALEEEANKRNIS